MFHGDLVEMHIEDKASPGFRRFLEKYRSRVDEPGLYVQFTYPRDPMDKRFAGQAMNVRDPYASDISDITKISSETGVSIEKILKDRRKIEKMKLQDPTIYMEPSHKDPVGLYAYPLEYVIHHPLDITYGSDLKALRVVKLHKGAKILMLQEATEDDFKYVLGKLTDYLEKEPKMRDADDKPIPMKQVVHEIMMELPDRKGNHYGHAIWYLIQYDGYWRLNHGWPIWEKTGRANPKQQWEKTKTLKWDAFEDTSWKRKEKVGSQSEAPIIYHGEPEQILIIRRNVFSIEETFNLLRKVRDPILGIKNEIGGIVLDDSEYQRQRRRIAEVSVNKFGDKILYRTPIQEQGLESKGKVSSLREIFEKLNRASAIDMIRYGETPLGSESKVPTLYMTGKGMASVHIESPFERPSHHRAKTDKSPEIISIEYMNKDGYGRAEHSSIPINQLSNSLKKNFPSEEWLVDKPEMDYETVKRAITNIVKVNDLFEDLYGKGRNRAEVIEFAVRVAEKVNLFMEIVGIEPLNYENLEDCFALLQALVAVSNAIPDALVLKVENNRMKIVNGKNTANYLLAQYNKDFEEDRKSTGSIDSLIEKEGLSQEDDWLVLPKAFDQYVKRHPELERAIHAIKWMTVLHYRIKHNADNTNVVKMIAMACDKAEALRDTGDLPFTDPERFGNDPTVHKIVWSEEDTEIYYQRLKEFATLCEEAKEAPKLPGYVLGRKSPEVIAKPLYDQKLQPYRDRLAKAGEDLASVLPPKWKDLMDEDLRSRLSGYFDSALSAFDACQQVMVIAQAENKTYKFYGYGISAPVKDNIKALFRSLSTIFLENNQPALNEKLVKAYQIYNPFYEEVKPQDAGSLVAKVQGGQTPNSPVPQPAGSPPSPESTTDDY